MKFNYWEVKCRMAGYVRVCVNRTELKRGWAITSFTNGEFGCPSATGLLKCGREDKGEYEECNKIYPVRICRVEKKRNKGMEKRIMIMKCKVCKRKRETTVCEKP